MPMPREQRAILWLVVFLALSFGTVQAQVRLSPAEANKLLLEKVEPDYPAIAKLLNLQETVQVEITVSATGAVTATKWLKGNNAFKVTALDAAKKRKYKPYVVGGKPTPFITTIAFPFSLGIPADEYERDKRIGAQFFPQDAKCRSLVKAQNWQEAEPACKATVALAEQFPRERELEKMGAYQMYGHVLMGQKRFQDALTYYGRAYDAVQSKLTEKDAELAHLYGDMAIAYHALRDLDKAIALYRQAEKVYQAAYANIGDDQMRLSYVRALKKLLELHLTAAEDAGATAEAEEVKKLAKSLP